MTKDISSENQEYYNRYWASHEQRLNTHEIVRLAEILHGVALVREQAGKTQLRICDLGCGRGWLSSELVKFGSVVGVDLSATGVGLAQERWPTVDFRVADITVWRPDEYFDLVVSSEVIEHIPDQQAFAETVNHLLRRGGYFICTTPNARAKKAWDQGLQGAQLVEKWLHGKELMSLFPKFSVIDHHSFIFDFSYHGAFRVTSAPKIIKILKSLGVMPLYDALRTLLNIGLYQIMVCKFSSDRS